MLPDDGKRVLEQKERTVPAKRQALEQDVSQDADLKHDTVLHITCGKYPTDAQNTPRNKALVGLAYSMVFSTCCQLTSAIYPGRIYNGLRTQVQTPAYIDAMVHTFYLMDALTSDTRVTKHKLKQIEKKSVASCRLLCDQHMLHIASQMGARY